MKKTYLIKDQGKGLVGNVTPDKLIDIASGISNESNSGGVDNSYSLIEEINTGGTWINGKPIYRKVIELDKQGLIDDLLGISNFIQNFEKIIKTDFTSYIDGNEYMGNILSGSPMNCHIEHTNTTEFVFKRWTDNTIIGTNDIEFELFEKIQIIVEYTKTTD